MKRHLVILSRSYTAVFTAFEKETSVSRYTQNGKIKENQSTLSQNKTKQNTLVVLRL